MKTILEFLNKGKIKKQEDFTGGDLNDINFWPAKRIYCKILLNKIQPILNKTTSSLSFPLKWKVCHSVDKQVNWANEYIIYCYRQDPSIEDAKNMITVCTIHKEAHSTGNIFVICGWKDIKYLKSSHMLNDRDAQIIIKLADDISKFFNLKVKKYYIN